MYLLVNLLTFDFRGRAYLTSGASNGHGKNDNAFNIFGLPQRSIFQQLSENNITWINYFNSSFNPDAEFYSWTQSTGKVATNVKPIAQFFTDAKAGKLPQFTYINPEVRIYTMSLEASTCADFEGPSVSHSAAASTRCTLPVLSTTERDSPSQSMRLFAALLSGTTLYSSSPLTSMVYVVLIPRHRTLPIH
jgi:hypothetical protein